MLRALKNNRAQAISAEYVLVFFLVLAILASMGIYFRRAIQARIYDARTTMVRTVRDRVGDHYTGNFYFAYEPYYANTITDTAQASTIRTDIQPGGTTGIFTKDYVDDRTLSNSISITAPPKDFN